MGFGSERQLRADLGADGPGPGRAFFTRIVQAELRCDPQVVRGRMLEGEPAVAGTRNRVRPIDIELDVSRKAEIDLDIGDNETPGDVTADSAELKIDIQRSRSLHLEVRWLEKRPRARISSRG